MFNSLRYTKVLEEAGVVRKQAEAHVEIMSDMMASHFATSNDLKDLRIEMSQKTENLQNKMEIGFKDLRTEMNDLGHEMKKLEYRMTIKIGGIICAAIGVTGTIMTILIKLT